MMEFVTYKRVFLAPIFIITSISTTLAAEINDKIYVEKAAFVEINKRGEIISQITTLLRNSPVIVMDKCGKIFKNYCKIKVKFQGYVDQKDLNKSTKKIKGEKVSLHHQNGIIVPLRANDHFDIITCDRNAPRCFVQADRTGWVVEQSLESSQPASFM